MKAKVEKKSKIMDIEKLEKVLKKENKKARQDLYFGTRDLGLSEIMAATAVIKAISRIGREFDMTFREDYIDMDK